MVPYRVANLSRLAPDPVYRRDHAYYERIAISHGFMCGSLRSEIL